ncbi:OSJNBb0021A09.15 [Oryza sativa (japonica cultivar-group)]
MVLMLSPRAAAPPLPHAASHLPAGRHPIERRTPLAGRVGESQRELCRCGVGERPRYGESQRARFSQSSRLGFSLVSGLMGFGVLLFRELFGGDEERRHAGLFWKAECRAGLHMDGASPGMYGKIEKNHKSKDNKKKSKIHHRSLNLYRCVILVPKLANRPFSSSNLFDCVIPVPKLADHSFRRDESAISDLAGHGFEVEGYPVVDYESDRQTAMSTTVR